MNKNGKERSEIEDIKEVLKNIPGALWDGAIEWGKAETRKGIFAFGLGFFRHLQLAVKKIPNEQRGNVAMTLRQAPYEYIEERLKFLKMEHIQNRKLYAAMLKALGELKEFQDGRDFDFPLLLKAVISLRRISRHNKEEALHILRDFKLHIESQLASIDDETKNIFESCKDILGQLDNMEDLLIRVNRVILDDNTKRFEKSYLDEFKREHGELQLLGIGTLDQILPIDPAFVSLSLKESDREGWKMEEAESILADQDELVIIGAAGAGKSTLLQWEAVQCARGDRLPNGKRNPWHNLIPFFIRLRHLDPGEVFPKRSKWVELSVPDWGCARDNHGEWIEKVIEEGRALLILDGLDEMPGNLRRDFWRELWKFVKDRDIMYRVSSRPIHRPGENDEEWKPPYNAAMFYVLPLSQEKVNLLIDKWHQAAIQYEPSVQNKKALAEYPATLKDKLWRQSDYRKISQLTQTPLLCSAICLINRYSEEKLPVRKSELYQILCKALLERDEKKKRGDGLSSLSDPLFDGLDVNLLFHIHSHLALSMIMNPTQDPETKDTEYLIQARESRILEWIKDPITYISHSEARKKAEEYPELLLRHLLDRRNLLREPGKGWIDFHHRGLQEYLAATALGKMKWIDFLVRNAEDDRWRDIIILSPGGYFANPDFGNELIDKLLLKANKTGSRIYYCLAVACLDTAVLPSPEIRNRAIEGLNKILPPRSIEEAQKVAAAGNAAVPLLKKNLIENKDKDIKTFCSLSLLCIGGSEAFNSLGEDLDLNILLGAFINSPPGTNILELPPVLSRIIKSGIVPEIIRDHIGDLSPFAGYEDLKYLDLCDCDKVKDISPLESIPHLYSLSLEGCKGIPDIRPLSRLIGIQSLNLGEIPGIADLSPIRSLNNLTYLKLSCCENLEKLEPISGLKNLRVLSLRGCDKIQDLSPVSGLKQLEKLDLGYCVGIEDFTPLQSLPNLKSLDLQGVKIPEGFQLPKSLPSVPTPGMNFLEIADGLYMKMVWIEGGEFKMGSPEEEEGHRDNESIHPVELDGFWIASTPVTQSQYEAIMGENPSHFKGDDLPVEQVTWHDSNEFCKKLSGKTGRGYSLPNEAQWEFACRAGSEGSFCFGDSDQRLEHFAWYGKNSDGKTHPVGLKRPNAWGLFDMHGNVWEWCADWYGEYGKEKCINPTGPKEGKYRMLRGGSWYNRSVYCRSACRVYYHPDDGLSGFGFRVVFVARTQKK